MAGSLSRRQRVGVVLSALWLIGGGLWGNNLGFMTGIGFSTSTVLVSGALTTPLTRMLPMMLARATSQRDWTHGLKGNTA